MQRKINEETRTIHFVGLGRGSYGDFYAFSETCIFKLGRYQLNCGLDLRGLLYERMVS